MVPADWGRRLPNFVTFDEAGGRFEYHRDIVRGPTLLIVGGGRGVVERIASALGDTVSVVAFGEFGECNGARVFSDSSGEICATLFPNNPTGPEAILADANQRLAARVDLSEVGLVELRTVLGGLGRPAAREHRATAPVMLLPNLLDPDLRNRLMQAFAEENREGTVAILDAEGAAALIEMPDRKRRRDLTLNRGRPLYADVRTAIADRLMPELWKAWWIDRLRPEAFYVASYEAGRGDFFAAHRDNSLPATADRRIAVSIELNDDYEGGGLVFPEYSDDRWRAPAGGGLAFSCSLLHEAVPVTAGCRYVLLAFLAAPA
ncbi:hypothetical protein BAL199_07538 [alpha proteobacterium BAL199]|jgi:hypothetical protein|nr:hypothetical protein BAL199_07538 [alpha proteobacterium BAL199]